MNLDKYLIKFDVSIPLPEGYTPSQRLIWIEKQVAAMNKSQVEAEYTSLLMQHEYGLLLSLEDVLDELFRDLD